MPRGVIAAASAAASPPDDPPALHARSCGLRVVSVDAVDRVPECAEHGEVGLAHQDRTGSSHSPDHLGIPGRHPPGEQQRPVRAGQPRHRDHLLDGERHAMQRPQTVAARNRQVRRGRLLPRAARNHDRIDLRVACLDALRVGLEQLRGAHLARADRARHPRRRSLDQLGHRRGLPSRRVGSAFGSGEGGFNSPGRLDRPPAQRRRVRREWSANATAATRTATRVMRLAVSPARANESENA